MSNQKPDQTLWTKATGLMDQHRWTEAIALWESHISREQTDYAARNKLGVCYAEIGELARAESTFRAVLEEKPDMPQALSNLGNIELSRGNTGTALELYQRAIRSDSDYAIAHKNLSIAYRKMGQLDKSVAALKRAHSLESRAQQSHGYVAPESERAAAGGRGLWTWVISAAAIIALLAILLFSR